MTALSPAQTKCLLAIRDGRGEVCLKGYRFSSAAILERHDLIVGDRGEPYWKWRLNDRGQWIANLAKPPQYLPAGQ